MASLRVDVGLANKLYVRAKAGRWELPLDTWRAALEASASHTFHDRIAGVRELERHLESLHLEDLALACACQAGSEAAWEHFVREMRPALYRAADAIAPGGEARELADSLYADLYGVNDRSSESGRSLLRYFHGRSTLATWLRAVLAQRYVDRVRSGRRSEPLDEPDSVAAPDSHARAVHASPDRPRFVRLVHAALRAALMRLDSKDRLRLGCYYAHGLTLAQTGKVLGEHEATVSRQLSRSRQALQVDIRQSLRAEGLGDAEIVECLESVMSDAGPLNLDTLLAAGAGRKESALDRSRVEEP